MSGLTLGSGHFQELYDKSPDPYGFTTRWYERRKYAVSLALLPWARYRSGFEPGCSIGELTALLAPRCETPGPRPRWPPPRPVSRSFRR